MSLLIPHVSPQGPCLFRMPWGRGLKCQGLGTLCGAWEPASIASSASRLSVIPSCSSSSSLGRREGDLPGVRGREWGERVCWAILGPALGRQRCPCSWQPPGKRLQRNFQGVGEAAGFSHLAGQDRAGSEARRGHGGSGQHRGRGLTCCRPSLGQGQG